MKQTFAFISPVVDSTQSAIRTVGITVLGTKVRVQIIQQTMKSLYISVLPTVFSISMPIS